MLPPVFCTLDHDTTPLPGSPDRWTILCVTQTLRFCRTLRAVPLPFPRLHSIAIPTAAHLTHLVGGWFWTFTCVCNSIHAWVATFRYPVAFHLFCRHHLYHRVPHLPPTACRLTLYRSMFTPPEQLGYLLPHRHLRHACVPYFTG